MRLDIRKKVLSDKKHNKQLTSVFLILVFVLEVTCASLLVTFATVNRYYEKYARGLRTLSVNKQYNSETPAFTSDEIDMIASIKHLTKVYPSEQRIAYETAYLVKDDKEDIEIEATFLGMDENNLPNKFHVDGNSLKKLVSEGAIVPDVLFDNQGTRIGTRNIIGKVLRISIDQIDFDAEIVPGEPAPRIGTEYIDLIVLGVYRTAVNPGSVNEIYVSFENVDKINRIMWHGYNYGDENTSLDLIVDDISNVAKVTETLESMGYQASPVSLVMDTFINIVSVALGFLTIVFLLAFGMIVHSIHKNAIARNNDDLSLMLVLGFAPDEIQKDALSMTRRQVLNCFVVSVLLCIIATMILSRDVTSDVGFVCGRMLSNLPLGAALSLLGEWPIIEWSFRSSLNELLKKPVTIEVDE